MPPLGHFMEQPFVRVNVSSIRERNEEQEYIKRTERFILIYKWYQVE